MHAARRKIMEWLHEFKAACRDRDFPAGRRLFVENPVAFVTWPPP